jgi:hypothetical protein
MKWKEASRPAGKLKSGIEVVLGRELRVRKAGQMFMQTSKMTMQRLAYTF